MSDRQVVHIAIHTLTATAELRACPQHAGRPVVVVGQGRRAVVLGTSTGAAALGACPAMPEWEARQRCPEAVFIVARRANAGPLLRRVTRICLRYTPLVQVVGLDEACLDVTGSLRLFGNAARIATRLVNEIRDGIGLDAQVGVSHNRLLARLAAHQAPPGRFVEVGAGDAPGLLASLPVAALHMLDAAGINWLAQAGVRRLGELRELPLPFLETRFGALGHLLAEAARGVDASPVARYEEPASCAQVTAETRVIGETCDREGLLAHVQTVVEAVAARLQQEDCMARSLCLTLRYADGTETPLRRSLPAFANSTGALYEPVVQMARKAEGGGRAVTAMRLAAGDLRGDDGAEQLAFPHMPSGARFRPRYTPRRPTVTSRARCSR
jgi:DNA polymerase-4